MQFVFSIAVILTGIFAGSSLFAQSEADTLRRYPPKTIEVTAPKPSDLSTVDPRLIEIKPTSELRATTASSVASDAFRAISSSLDVRRYGTLGAVALPSFRGLPAQYTTIYRDGIRVTNEQLGETDLGQLTLHGISRVELVPSSSAIVLGADATGAVIDLVSASADSTSLMIGSDQTNYAHGSGLPENSYYANASLRLSDDLGVRIAGSLDQSTGAFPFYQSSTGVYVSRENNDATLQSAALTARYKIDERTSLSLISNYFSAERGSPGAVTTPYRGASSLDERLKDQQSLYAITFNRSDAGWNLSADLSYQNQYESFVGASEGLGDSAADRLAGVDINANVMLTDHLIALTGASYLHSIFEGSTDAVSNPSQAIDRDRLQPHIGILWQPSSAFEIASVLRYDYVSDVPHIPLLPEALVQYEPVDGLHLGVSYSRNAIAPTLNDLYWKTLGNPKLVPERANEGQFSVRYDRDLFGAPISIGATTFYVNSQNAILWLPSTVGGSLWHPMNVGVDETSGAEITASATFSLGREISLQLSEDYTLLSALNTTPNDPAFGNEILYSSPTRSLFIARLAKDEWGSASLVVHYRGHEYTDAANTLDGMLQPATIWDVTIASKPFTIDQFGLKIFGAVQNLLDTPYEEVLDYPMPGRTYKVSIEVMYH